MVRIGSLCDIAVLVCVSIYDAVRLLFAALIMCHHNICLQQGVHPRAKGLMPDTSVGRITTASGLEHDRTSSAERLGKFQCDTPAQQCWQFMQAKPGMLRCLGALIKMMLHPSSPLLKILLISLEAVLCLSIMYFKVKLADCQKACVWVFPKACIWVSG